MSKDQEFKRSGFAPLSAVEAAASYLENKIIQNELKPGQRLIERKLAELLGMSKIPIREAFRKLEISGLIRVFAEGDISYPFYKKGN